MLHLESMKYKNSVMCCNKTLFSLTQIKKEGWETCQIISSYSSYDREKYFCL